MKREFTINIILLLLINFLIKPAYIFGVDARVQNLVGTEAYGTYFAYFNFVFLFQFLNDPGLQTWNAQYVPKNRDNIDVHFSNVIILKTAIGISFLTFIFLLGKITGYQKTEILLLVTISLILSTLFILLRTTIAGLGYYKVDSLLSALDKFVMLIIIGYLVWFSTYKSSFTVEMFLYGQAVSFIISIVIAGLFLISKVSFSFKVISKRYIFNALQKSTPYILTALFMTIYTKLDGIMLDKMIDDNDFQAGVYATAYRFYDAANMTTYLFAALVLPMFAANFNDNKVLGDLYNIAVRLVIVVSVIISTVLFTFSNELIDVLLDNYDQQSIAVLKILSITYLIMSISYILGSLMIAKNNLRKLNYLFLGGIIVNVLLNGIFISRFEAIGAAFATLITQTMILIGQYIIVFYETKLKLELLTLVKIIGYALLTILFSHYVQISFSFGVIYKLIIIITFALLFALSLRLILRSDLGRVYKI